MDKKPPIHFISLLQIQDVKYYNIKYDMSKHIFDMKGYAGK
jgi:hypothetical protein